MRSRTTLCARNESGKVANAIIALRCCCKLGGRFEDFRERQAARDCRLSDYGSVVHSGRVHDRFVIRHALGRRSTRDAATF